MLSIFHRNILTPKQITSADLELAYTTSDKKHTYYRFPKAMNMPVERLGEMFRYLQFLTKGLSPQEDDAIDNAIEKALNDGLKEGTAAARIGALIMERRKRKQICFHTELFYNYLAVQWVRDDENPYVFSNEIQMQKVIEIKKEAIHGKTNFFFHLPELKGLISLLNITAEDVPLLMQKSEEEMQLLKEKLKLISSFQSSSPNLSKNGKRA